MKASAVELRRIAEWLQSDDVGESSLSLCAIFLGLPAKTWEKVSYPHDPADFNRCMVFLSHVDTGKRLGLIRIAAGYRQQWRAISEHWDELVALYNEEHAQVSAPKLYKKMKELGL